MRKVRAIVYAEYGEPTSVIQLQERILAEPGPGEVYVAIKAAPINPADINTIEGKYPIKPELPAVPGVEGAGIVEALGPQVDGIALGDQVLLPHRTGTWQEGCILKADSLYVAPKNIPLETAATLKINPATAWRLLHDYATLKPGDWVIQNAGNSAVGRAVIQISKKLGFKTISLVRREELFDELKNDGADLVLLDDEEVKAKVKEATAGAKIKLALNAVGGESALRVANCLAANAVHVTYGAMGRQPVKIPNGLLIFKDIVFRGCWVSRWYGSASRQETQAMFEQLYKLAEEGLLKTKIEKRYSIEEAAAALAHAQKSQRAGKILFEMNNA